MTTRKNDMRMVYSTSKDRTPSFVCGQFDNLYYPLLLFYNCWWVFVLLINPPLTGVYDPFSPHVTPHFLTLRLVACRISSVVCCPTRSSLAYIVYHKMCWCAIVL